MGTGAATTTVAETGVGFTPTALIFFWSGRGTTEGMGAGNGRMGMGFAIGTGAADAQWMATYHEDGLATTDTRSTIYQNGCVGLVAGNGVVEGTADVQSLDVDGFTLEIQTQFTEDIYVGYIALDAANVAIGEFNPASATQQTETGVGFQPDGLVLFHNGTVIIGDASHGIFAMGFASGTAAAEQFTAGFTSRHGVTPGAAGIEGYSQDAEFIHTRTSTSTGQHYSLDSFDADGFTYTPDGTAAYYNYYLAIGGIQIKVGNFLMPTDTNNLAISGVGFQPEAVMFSSFNRAKPAFDAEITDINQSLGAASSATDRCAFLVTEDVENPTEVARGASSTACLTRGDLADGLDAAMDLVSMDSDGFTVVMDDASAVAAYVGYIAFGPAGGGGGGGGGAQRGSGATPPGTRRGYGMF